MLIPNSLNLISNKYKVLTLEEEKTPLKAGFFYILVRIPIISIARIAVEKVSIFLFFSEL